MLTNDQLDRLIDQAKPRIREAIRAVVENGNLFMFELAEFRDSEAGAGEKCLCFFAPFVSGAVLEGAMAGLEEGNRRAQERARARIAAEHPLVVRPS